MPEPWRPGPLRGPWTPAQAATAAAIADHPRVVVTSGNGLGKTHLLADLTASYSRHYPASVVLITAPTRHQLRGILWPAIKAALRATGAIDDAYTRNDYHAGDRHIKTIATNAPERLQGTHADHLLIIADEASGLDTDLLAALHGCAVGDQNRILLLGNPNSTDGALYAAWQMPTYHRLTLSALDHPNVLTRTDAIPGAVTWSSIRQMLLDWTREQAQPTADSFPLPVDHADIPPATANLAQPRHWLPSDEFRVRVLGQWPSAPPGSLFRPADLAECTGQPLTPDPNDRHAAADIARLGGDRTVYTLRDGPVIIRLDILPADTIPGTANQLQTLLHRDRPKTLTIDAAGLGIGVSDLLQSSAPCPVRPFIGADRPRSPADAARYANRRATAYARLAILTTNKAVSLPVSPDLLEELQLIRSTHDDQHRLTLGSKENTRATLGRSTDLADAVSMLFDVGLPTTAQPAPPPPRRRRPQW